MLEKKYDRKLGIRTDGLREWRDAKSKYNRYEATPYKALDALFQTYKLKDTDRVVDFGCGRGRVAFYTHHRFKVPITGIEVNERTFEEALDNKSSYRMRANHIPAPIRLEFGFAEQYEIHHDDNRFYFFNPFSIEIFAEVVENIMQSLAEHDRAVDLILYYPLAEFKAYLSANTPFRLMNKVPVPEAKDRKEKFLIYRYVPGQARTE